MVLDGAEPTTSAENVSAKDLSCSDSLKNVLCPPPTSFEYFTERYYNHYLFENCKKIAGNSVRILQHTNGLCVVCIDPSHAALQAIRIALPEQKLSILSVVFGTGRGNSIISAGGIEVVGKKKKNALVCQSEMKLCTLMLSDGSSYPIPACLNGFIIEKNESLMTNPWMVAAAPTAEGFLAVINPSAKNDFMGMKRVWTATGGDLCIEEQD